MLAYLHFATRQSLTVTLLRWCNAVMQSEFIAALAWMVNAVMISGNIVTFPDIGSSLLIMATVYAIVLIPLEFSIFHRESHRDWSIRRSTKEIAASFSIVLGAYTLSSISFITPNSIFGISMGAGVLFIRTISETLQGLFERQYEQYQQFRVNHETMQQIYHDLKHQIDYIRSENNSEAREERINHLENIVHDYEAQYESGNAVLNVLLTSKEMLCRSRQITMECFVDASQMGFMDPIHICSIFGNAINNAIEYECQIDDIEKRLIKISVFTENLFLMIHISNYCEQKILNSESDPQTTKEDPSMHGFGIKGIRLAAEQYSGHMTLTQKNNWFMISILIPISTNQLRSGTALP